jgi:hypothetical protein
MADLRHRRGVYVVHNGGLRESRKLDSHNWKIISVPFSAFSQPSLSLLHSRIFWKVYSNNESVIKDIISTFVLSLLSAQNKKQPPEFNIT